MKSITLNPLNDEFSTIKLMGYSVLPDDIPFVPDQMPLLAARVSTGRDDKTGQNKQADLNLLDFLASRKHISPFEHLFVTFLVACPLFVAREWQRHRTVFFSFNEESQRYTSSSIGKFWFPKFWRKQSTKNKQSSEGEISGEIQEHLDAQLRYNYAHDLAAYQDMAKSGVAREMARAVTPMGNYTRMYVSATIRSWNDFIILRDHPAAQEEIRVYAKSADEILGKLYPTSWETLRNNRYRLEKILKYQYNDVWKALVAEGTLEDLDII